MAAARFISRVIKADIPAGMAAADPEPTASQYELYQAAHNESAPMRSSPRSQSVQDFFTVAPLPAAASVASEGLTTASALQRSQAQRNPTPPPEPARRQEPEPPPRVEQDLQREALWAELQNHDDARSAAGMSTAQMEYQVRKRRMGDERKTGVRFMRQALRLIVFGIEASNRSIGPFMHLDGWSDHASPAIDEMGPALDRCYDRYWRKGAVNPLFEVAFILAGSMVTYHMSQAGRAPLETPAFSTPSAERDQRRDQSRPRMRRPSTSPRPAPARPAPEADAATTAFLGDGDDVSVHLGK